MRGSLLFLGTGASAGVPLIGCNCSVCISSSAFNKRLRPSALLRLGEKQILIDAGPDFRQQALRFGIQRLDGVILTHTHFDHTGGLDELRVFYLIDHQPLPCLISYDTLEEIKIRRPYFFEKKQENRSLSAQLDFICLLEKFGEVRFLDIPFHIVSYSQGGVEVIGFRVGNLAFISDIKNYSQKVIDEIRGVDILIVSALQEPFSPVHFNIEEAIDFSCQVGAARTWLTHISHGIDHAAISEKLPSNVFLAYDGLLIDDIFRI